jgi:hypothetical protein
MNRHERRSPRRPTLSLRPVSPAVIERSEFAAAALVLLVFAGFWSWLYVSEPPIAAEVARADPLLQWVATWFRTQAWGGLWLIPIISALVAILWLAFVRPEPLAIKRAGVGALIGLLPGLIGVILGHTGGGQWRLPDFAPAGLSPCAGPFLGLGASLLDESWFRLAALPIVYWIARRFLTSWKAVWFSAILTGILLAGIRQWGPGAMPWTEVFFLFRFLLQGLLISLLAFRPGPSFAISLSCSLSLLDPYFLRCGIGPI